MVLTDPGLRDRSRKSVEADVNRKFDMMRLLGQFPRPSSGQRVVYNRQKRVVGLKFQSVTLRNGLINN